MAEILFNKGVLSFFILYCSPTIEVSDEHNKLVSQLGETITTHLEKVHRLNVNGELSPIQ